MPYIENIGEIIVCWDTRVADDLSKLLKCLHLGIECRSKVEYQIDE